MANKKQEMPKHDPLVRGSVQEISHAHHTFVAVVKRAMSQEELEDPSLWQHMQHTFSLFDRVQAESSNGAMIAFGVVTHVKNADIRVKFYDIIDLESVAVEEMDYEGFKIRNTGFQKQWEIVHKSNGRLLKDHMPTQAEALVYLQSHLKQVQ